MNPRIAVTTLWAEDVPAAAHFYRDVIGLKLLPHQGSRPHFDLGGSFLTIIQGKPVAAMNSQPERFPLLAFAVENLDEATAHLQAHSIVMPWGIERDENTRWVMLYDPAGNLIELVQF